MKSVADSIRTTEEKQRTDTAPHVIVQALAGTGKTTTLVEGLKRLFDQPTSITPSPQQQAVWDTIMLSKDHAATVGFCAFNKSIAEELQRRVPAGCSAMTMHSMGLKAVTKHFGRVKITSDRVQDIICKITGKEIWDLRRDRMNLLRAVDQLVSLCKMNLVGNSLLPSEDVVSEEDLEKLASYYDIDLNGDREEVFQLVPKVLERCLDVSSDMQINFDDMIWLPVALDLPVFKYDLLLVDECVPGWTPVMLADGRSMTIQQIVESKEEIRVRAYNTTRGIGQNCRVIAKQKILNQKPLVKIKAKHFHKTGTNRKSNFVICTVDHQVWTTNRGWVAAGEIRVGDDLIIETAAKTTQKGKITTSGREHLANIHIGNKLGVGNKPTKTAADFNRIKGGNGRGPTLAEQTLLEALGKGWKWQYIVRTGCAPQFGRGDMPGHYKIDIANPEMMIAVEVDGHTHRNSKEIDNKKQSFLEENGWTVFRVSNRKAIQNTVEEACKITGNCPRPARVTCVEPVTIKDNYVYDITIEDCHNFYANGVLVHNCQDLNRCQQQLALMASNRLILCGDSGQAIYGFAGADSQSLARMQETLSAKSHCIDGKHAFPECLAAEGASWDGTPHVKGCQCTTTDRGVALLPLTVTRRCGKAIVTEAQKIVPEFEAHESNGEGKVSNVSLRNGMPVSPQGLVVTINSRFVDVVNDGDMIISRVNAPLVSLCFKFIKAKKKANIQGRKVGEGLIALIKKMKCSTVVELQYKLCRWLSAETQREQAKKFPSESRLLGLQDRYDCVCCFMEGETEVPTVITKINDLFTDDTQPNGIRLSSIHRSKGLEARRVFFLQTKDAPCPHPMAKSAWEKKQESNLKYVGITRAIEELIYVTD